MDAKTILVFGAVLFGFGSMGFFVAWVSNRALKGLGWMGASFASAAAAFGILFIPHLLPLVRYFLPDLLALLSFVFAQMAISELFGGPLLPKLGLMLLGATVISDLLYFEQFADAAFRVTVISIMVTMQCADIARQLKADGQERRSAAFCSHLLFGFSTLNLLRSFLTASGMAYYWHISAPVAAFSFLLFIVTGLGFAFGFFWMSNAMLSAQLEELAGTDPLTRVANRRTFLRACERELRNSLRKAKPFSILMADIDHFKNVNDRFGHETGDEALIAVVERMQDSIRGLDVLARWGGEEFVVLLPHANEQAAGIVAERMRANVERAEMPFLRLGEPDDEELKLTISIGTATVQPQDDISALLRRADECLYLAKDAGRNRVLQMA